MPRVESLAAISHSISFQINSLMNTVLCRDSTQAISLHLSLTFETFNLSQIQIFLHAKTASEKNTLLSYQYKQLCQHWLRPHGMLLMLGYLGGTAHFKACTCFLRKIFAPQEAVQASRHM